MKKKNILLLLSIVAGFMIIGQFQTVASEIYETENKQSVEQDASEEQGMEKNLDMEDQAETPKESGAQGEENNNDRKDVSMKDEISGDDNAEDAMQNAEDDIQVQDMEELSAADALYYQGLIYFCNRYQYDCEITYLQKYLEYINLEVDACKKMYSLGEITAADLQSYQAKQASVEAQLTVAKNQRDYNDLFLKENNLDYSSYVIKEKKDVQSVNDYLNQYPAKNHMTMAGYVTGYQNALAYIGAKEMEIDALEMQQEAAKLLYDVGEISKMEFKQQETAVAKAQYELEQYYVEMNLAYINLVIFCK
ncbi:MAG: hypothetical protein K2J90_04480 [Lachnospiraceae bacterium]|nr:hypothetical protein [Lachnospiraceae bacterium]